MTTLAASSQRRRITIRIIAHVSLLTLVAPTAICSHLTAPSTIRLVSHQSPTLSSTQLATYCSHRSTICSHRSTYDSARNHPRLYSRVTAGNRRALHRSSFAIRGCTPSTTASLAAPTPSTIPASTRCPLCSIICNDRLPTIAAPQRLRSRLLIAVRSPLLPVHCRLSKPRVCSRLIAHDRGTIIVSIRISLLVTFNTVRNSARSSLAALTSTSFAVRLFTITLLSATPVAASCSHL